MSILRRLERRDTTFQQVFQSDSDAPASPFNDRAVTRNSALGLSAVFACVRFITDAISTLPIHNAAGVTPDWLEAPIPRDPNTTRVVHIQQVVTSLLLEGNSYTIASPNVAFPAELRVLDPRLVDPRRESDGSVTYVVRDHRHRLVGEFGSDQIIHIPLIRLPGEIKGISPLEAERQTFSSAAAAEELARRFLHNGTWLSAIVEAPTGVSFTKDQADELIGRIERKYSGSRNAGKVGLLTQGATLRPLSPTPEQAQFLETRQYDDERIFRIFRVPPALAGMIREGATSNASSVSQALAFEKHTVRPAVSLIEEGYSRIEPIKFNTKGLLRGDPLTQAQIYHYALGDQYATKDEVRGWEDLPLFGDERGGFLETPNNNAPGGTPA